MLRSDPQTSDHAPQIPSSAEIALKAPPAVPVKKYQYNSGAHPTEIGVPGRTDWTCRIRCFLLNLPDLPGTLQRSEGAKSSGRRTESAGFHTGQAAFLMFFRAQIRGLYFLKIFQKHGFFFHRPVLFHLSKTGRNSAYFTYLEIICSTFLLTIKSL